MKLGKCYRERCFLSCHERGTKKKNSESHEEKHLYLQSTVGKVASNAQRFFFSNFSGHKEFPYYL